MKPTTKFRIPAIALALAVGLGAAFPAESQVILPRDGTEHRLPMQELMRKDVYVSQVGKDDAGNAVLILSHRTGCKPGRVYFCELHTKEVRTDAESLKRIICYEPRQFDVCGIGTPTGF